MRKELIMVTTTQKHDRHWKGLVFRNSPVEWKGEERVRRRNWQHNSPRWSPRSWWHSWSWCCLWTPGRWPGSCGTCKQRSRKENISGSVKVRCGTDRQADRIIPLLKQQQHHHHYLPSDGNELIIGIKKSQKHVSSPPSFSSPLSSTTSSPSSPPHTLLSLLPPPPPLTSRRSLTEAAAHC